MSRVSIVSTNRHGSQPPPSRQAHSQHPQLPISPKLNQCHAKTKGVPRRVSPRVRLGLALLASVLITGCGSRSSCPADFTQAGLADGRAGVEARLPANACRASDVERARYFKARHEGLAWFCGAERVFSRARLGERIKLEACPVQWRPGSAAADIAGQQLFVAELEIRRLRGTAERFEKEGRFTEMGGFDLRAKSLQEEVDAWIERAAEQGWLTLPVSEIDTPVGAGTVLRANPVAPSDGAQQAEPPGQ